MDPKLRQLTNLVFVTLFPSLKPIAEQLTVEYKEQSHDVSLVNIWLPSNKYVRPQLGFKWTRKLPGAGVVVFWEAEITVLLKYKCRQVCASISFDNKGEPVATYMDNPLASEYEAVVKEVLKFV